MDNVIDINNLGKKYTISHRGRSSGFMRDTVSALPRMILKGVKNFFSGMAVQHPQTEDLWALREIFLEVKQGQRVGIIGRNGSGKTTLLKVLSRITEPTTGIIRIKGRVASLLEVGTGFHPELTGRENIYLNGAILGMTKNEIKKKFDEIVDFADVEMFLDTPVKHYSSGMYVRLAFAVAAHLEPEILLVDEVLAVGDIKFQRKCLGKVRQFGREGRTVMFVSHDMGTILSLCDRAIVLDAGMLMKDDRADSSVNYYMDMQSNKEITPVKDRKDRRGTGLVRITGIEIRDSKGSATNSVEMGEDFTVSVNFEGQAKHLSIAVIIGNSLKSEIIRGVTFESANEDVDIEDRLTAECRFNTPRLIQGLYDVNVWVGQVNGDVHDYLERADILEVRPSDVFGTGRLPEATPLHPHVFSPVEWKFKKEHAI